MLKTQNEHGVDILTSLIVYHNAPIMQKRAVIPCDKHNCGILFPRLHDFQSCSPFLLHYNIHLVKYLLQAKFMTSAFPMKLQEGSKYNLRDGKISNLSQASEDL